MMRVRWLGVVAMWLLLAGVAHAQARAWLERDRIALGETTTLNVETDQADAAPPDYSQLFGEFVVSGNSSTQTYRNVNGVGHTRILYAVALQPRREGIIGIPALRIGNARTQPLTLTVTPSAATPAHAGDAVFIESETDAQDPYVQQAVGYTVRLYYAMPLVSGQLEQPDPDGASLQQVGDDVKYTRDIGGRQYNVFERHYLLLPEHSGTLTIPAPTFHGSGAGGFFDDLFGDGQRDLSASATPRFLHVQSIPANAPQPWLPLRALGLRYLNAPGQARAGEAVTVTLEATADGATAAQMPELQLQARDVQAASKQAAPVQIFADPVQAQESFAEGRPQVRLTRRFSIVPAQAGVLHVGVPAMQWWDTRAGIGRSASVPDLTLQVAPGVGGGAASPTTTGAQSRAEPRQSWIHVPGVQGPVRPWALAAALLALLWLVTFAWGLHRKPHPQAAAPVPTTPHAPAGRLALQRVDLKQALDHGALGEVADALCGLATPPVADLDALRTRLADPAQQAAIDALQRALWADGDGVAARTALRAAFRAGPHWREATVAGRSPLPPLYPRD